MENSFETEVKDKLKWKLKRWQREGEPAWGIKRLVNSMKYWNGRLQSAKKKNNVILTLYHERIRLYPSLQKIAEKLSIINSDIEIVGYCKFKNKRFLSLTFDSLEAKEFVLQNLTTVEEGKVAYLEWVDEVLLDTVTIDWLSDQTELDIVMNYFEKYMEIFEMRKIDTILDPGKNCVSGWVVLKGKFKEGVSIDQIPHITEIDGMECLILIEGRSYQCFTCSKLGHKAVNCLKAFCRYCKCVCYKRHNCVRVYGELMQMDQLQESNLARQEDMETDDNVELNNTACSTDTVCNKNLFFDAKITPLVSMGNVVTGLVEGGGGLQHSLRQKQKAGEISNCGLAADGHIPKNWFDEVVGEIGKTKKSDFITEDVKKGHPNFILIDTSTSESDSDSDINTGLIAEAEGWMSKWNNTTDFARTFMDTSFQSLNKEAVENKKDLQELDKLDVGGEQREDVERESQLISKKIEEIESHILENNILMEETGCKKKVKKKRLKGKVKSNGINECVNEFLFKLIYGIHNLLGFYS